MCSKIITDWIKEVRMEREMKVNTFAVEDVKNLKMDIAAANVRTEAATDNEIRVEAKNLDSYKYVCELQAGKLVISHQIKGVMHLSCLGYENAEIVLYLPANLVLDRVSLEIGAGDVSMDEVPFTCSKMKVEIGAGKWKAELLTVLEKLKVEIGVGKAKMKEVTAGRVSIECGAGSCIYKGRINGDAKVECSVGKCSFQLENKESDFDYDISCALGSVTINGNKIKSFAAQKTYKNENVIGKAELGCGLGSIEWKTDVAGRGFTK